MRYSTVYPIMLYSPYCGSN